MSVLSRTGHLISETEVNPLPPPAALMRALKMGRIAGARDPASGKPLSATSLEGLYYNHAGYCCYCAEPMMLPSRRPTLVDIRAGNRVTRDHISPQTLGHPGLASNFAAACNRCNNEKRDLPMLIYFLARAQNNVLYYRALYEASKVTAPPERVSQFRRRTPAVADAVACIAA